ncbi:MAG: lipopolysaccharide biosynthesis protein [Janthinobacterium lividum]
MTLALKVTGTSLMMGIFLLAARSMSPQGFGQLAVSFNALSFLAVLAVFGQDVLVVRSWGEYTSAEAHGLALGAYRFGWIVVTVSAVGFGLVTLAVGILNPYYRFSLVEAAAGSAFLTAQILLLFAAQTTRVVVNFMVSETNRELTWRLVLLPVVVVGLWTGLSPTAFYGAAAAGMVVAVALQLSSVRRRFPEAIRAARPEMRRSEWIRRARSMWSSAVLEAAAQYAEVLLLGLLVSPAVAGVYFVAARMANVFAMMSGGLHSYTSTHASSLYHAGQRSALQALFRSVMTMALLIAGPLIVLVAVFGNLLLDIFGRHYADGYWVLILLSIGSFTAALAGPSNGLLLVSGHERLYSRVLFAALLVRVGLITWAAPRFGAIGAAGAWTLVTGPVAIGLAAATRRLTGIDPSVFSLVGRAVPPTALELDPR